MEAYVINMESRADRWRGVLDQSSLLGIPFLRIPAEPHGLINWSQERFAPAGVISTWKSHQKAMRTFLESVDSHGLILEDDFVASCNLAELIEKSIFDSNVDFVQLGFLYTSPQQFLAVKFANFLNNAFRLIGLVANLLRFKFPTLANKTVLLETASIPYGLIPNDIRAGGHAYIVSRKFASAAQELNTPVFLSTDGVYMSLGWMRAFRMYRVRLNKVRQSNSQSSVEGRTIN
jgi:GR25 family glycosyltransferase involved in LPS biosynthesis